METKPEITEKSGRGPAIPSERQIGCLRCKAKGKTMEETAESMGMSVSSVSRELYGVYCLLGVKNAVEAVAVGMREGWLVEAVDGGK